VVSEAEGVVECVLESPGDQLERVRLTFEELAAAIAPANDGLGDSLRAVTALWALWMQSVIPRIRQATLATRPVRPYGHQDEAVFTRMLPQPRLRFLLADEPGTGKTIMTGLYLAEARRRGLVPGKTVIVVPAHLVPKWMRDLDRFFGIASSKVTAEVGRDPQDLRPDVDVWVVSLDLYTFNDDVRRKVAGDRASWSLTVFDEAHRLTPTSQYLGAARQLARASHHLLLLTATPHRGKEDFFRALLNLLDERLYPILDTSASTRRLVPGGLHFLRRMKEELVDLDGNPLFPPRVAERVPVNLTAQESDAYEAVMDYVATWYGPRSMLAASIYGKRAASSLIAARETLGRRRDALAGSQVGHVEPLLPRGFERDDFEGAAVDDDDAWARAETAVVETRSRDRRAERDTVEALFERLDAMIRTGTEPSKWVATLRILEHHGLRAGDLDSQLLVFSEFADTARWLRSLFSDVGYTTELLEGEIPPIDRDRLQQRFLARDFQVLVSTDAGGEGIDLQSANVMLNWDIPWSLVRLEQRMGRLHRIGQTRPVHIYHLVAPDTREGRVQEVMLANLIEAGDALQGRIFDLIDATASSLSFNYSRALVEAQGSPRAAEVAATRVPTADRLVAQAQELIAEEDALRSSADPGEAQERYAADRRETINPIIVEGFVRQLATRQGFRVAPGPSEGLLVASAPPPLPPALGPARSALVAADAEAVEAARRRGVDVTGIHLLGPAEPGFAELVEGELTQCEADLRRGSRASDTGSLSDYTLLVYSVDVEYHDGARTTRHESPFCIRWSAGQAFPIAWESAMNLVAIEGRGRPPTPAARLDGESTARRHVNEVRERIRGERAAWVGRARADLDDIEARYRQQIASLDDETRAQLRAAFQEEKTGRLTQLEAIETVTAGEPRLVGWLDVAGTADPATIGSDPDSEIVAVRIVHDELAAQGFAVDDRQTAGLGYDLYAHHRATGEQRLVEVKGQLSALRAVTLERHEWAQALQRGSEYWLYVVVDCATSPRVYGRIKDPAGTLGPGSKLIERFQIPASVLREVVEG
jgi:SNF2 family DNA or RNA helicase